MTALAHAAPPHADPRIHVLGRLRRHGWEATSFQSLEADFTYWFDDATDACIAYVDTRAAAPRARDGRRRPRPHVR